jgi:two-component system cell cycle sensor histidine kinase/response regulator CckA
MSTVGQASPPSDISLEQIASIRERHLNGAIVAVAVLGFPALVAVIAAGWRQHGAFGPFAYAVLYAAVLTLWGVRRWLRVAARALVLAAIIFAASALSLALVGLDGLGIPFLMVACTVTALTFGRWPGVMAAAAGLVLIAATGSAICRGWLPLAVDPVEYTRSPAAWVTIATGYLLACAVVVVSSDRIQHALEVVTRTLAQRTHEVDEKELRLLRECAERSTAEQNLAAWKQRFEFVGAVSGHVVYDHNLADGAVVWSGSIKEVLGYDLAEMTGGIAQHQELIDPADRDRVRSHIEQVHKLGAEYDVEYSVRHRNGHFVRVHDRGRLMVDGEGGPGHLVGVMRDITHELHLQEQLRQAQRMEAVGLLATGVAHDFNNLLTPIIGYADLLSSDLGPESSSAESLGEIRRAADRARTLTQRLLTFGRKAAVELKRVDLSQVVLGFQKILRRTIREDVALRVQTEAEHCFVLGDTAQFELALMNLAVNAQDAMPDGGTLTISTREVELGNEFCEAHEPLKPGAHVALSVSDTGTGIPAEIAAHIFEPFFTTKPSGKGTGVGLATVYGIVKQHRGAVAVASTPGEGTVVSAFFPSCTAAAMRIETASAGAMTLMGTETVVVVEDEDQVRRLSREALSSHGYRVLEASSPEECIHLLNTFCDPVHLLLADVVMPGLNGRQLFESLVRTRPTLKVLYMSGYPQEIVSHRGVLDFGLQVLPKPFTADMLARKVRQVLDGVCA